MKKIPLTQNKFALVDDEDYDDLNQFKWYAHKSGNTYYACRKISHPIKPKKQYDEKMHRKIMGLKFGNKLQPDHLDHNGLNNQKLNLRITDKIGNAENMYNQSKYGVGINKLKQNKANPYMLRIKINNKRIYIGCYLIPELAQLARKIFLSLVKFELSIEKAKLIAKNV
jgi:hypothetical protein